MGLESQKCLLQRCLFSIIISYDSYAYLSVAGYLITFKEGERVIKNFPRNEITPFSFWDDMPKAEQSWMLFYKMLLPKKTAIDFCAVFFFALKLGATSKKNHTAQ